jgi:hypothetical protein
MSKSGYSQRRKGGRGEHGRPVVLECSRRIVGGIRARRPAADVLLAYGLCVVIAPFIYKYYLGLLAQGAAPEGSLERQDYDRVRTSLAGDNLATRLYTKWLTAFLDWVERFFGDAGMADRTLFPHAFGLKKPTPLWTAPALDRCLQLAFVYPIATIFLIWTVSGHVGPAEAALRFKPDISGWARVVLAVATGLPAFAFWRFVQTLALWRGDEQKA